MIQPTVGRVVWFFKHVQGQGFKGPLAAIIAHVHWDGDDKTRGMVNLLVIDNNGNPRPECSVPLEHQPEDAHVGSYCTWMPYQKGQAAKTEALEKQLGK